MGNFLGHEFVFFPFAHIAQFVLFCSVHTSKKKMVCPFYRRVT